MNSADFLITSLVCLGILRSLSSTPLTSAPVLNLLVNESQNETNEKDFYTISTYSEGFTQSYFQVLTSTGSVPPTPPDGYWDVTDGNVTCIRAHLKIRFKIDFYNETRYLVLPPNADASHSSCRTPQKDQILSLRIDKKFDLAFTFEKISENSYALKNITLTLFSPEGANQFYNDIKLFSVQNQYSYWCQSLFTVSMKNVSLESFKMRIQAFGGKEKKFGQAQICPDDDRLSTTVTIIVPCILSGLFIIILIICTIKHRQRYVKDKVTKQSTLAIKGLDALQNKIYQSCKLIK